MLSWLMLEREADVAAVQLWEAAAESVPVDAVVECVSEREEEVDPIVEAGQCAVDPLRERPGPVGVGVDASWCVGQGVDGAVRELGEPVRVWCSAAGPPLFPRNPRTGATSSNRTSHPDPSAMRRRRPLSKKSRSKAFSAGSPYAPTGSPAVSPDSSRK